MELSSSRRLDTLHRVCYSPYGMKIIEAKPQENFNIFLRFDDGSSGSVDLSAYAGRGVFASWRVPAIFQQVVITESGALEWPGEIDLCADALYLRLTRRSPEDLFPNLHGALTHA